MPRIHWKLIFAVFLLAIGVRAALQWKSREVQPGHVIDDAPPTLANVESEEESGKGDAPEDASGAPEEDPVTAESKGALAFDNHPIELKPRPEDEEIATSFTFTNTSTKPLTITGLESTCSCLEASLDKRTYAPGEKGSGKAVFKVTNFTGRNIKTIHIYSDNPEFPDQVVSFILDVPVIVSVTPEILDWQLDETPTTKEMTIKMLGDKPIHIKNVIESRGRVDFQLKELTPGREYRLSVTPKSTKEVSYGYVKIETDSKIPKYAGQMVFYRILRPELADKLRDAAEKKAAGAVSGGKQE
ncbi:hypothetical protein AYO49_03235 [Verrucomicrobiaceae bacterium SCGC AG-212-N21]|nr:hypothetical protein AYO49_03235 [Verrucomicrobiaceae bacterium SCGC AG-212-N21]